MATTYKMQAVSTDDGERYTWVASTRDFAAAGFPGPGSARSVCVVSTVVDDTGGGGGSITIDTTLVDLSGTYGVAQASIAPLVPASTPAIGSSNKSARQDHVHPMPAVSATLTNTGSTLAVAQATATPAALGSAAVGSSAKSAKEDHVHAMPRLDQLGLPTAELDFNSEKLIHLANGTASNDAVNLSQMEAGDAATLATAEAYTDAAVSASVPDATASVKGILRLAGDFAGSATSPLVAKLQGNPVDSTALGAGQDTYVLTWDNTAGKIIAKVAASGFTAGGDLSGTSTSQTVAKVHGASVPAAGALVTGNAPYVSGTSALTYQALNLAGGSGWVTGVLPAGNLPALNGITAPTGDVAFNSHKATGLADGVASSDAATVGQLSAVVAGLSQKSACRALASANVASMSGLPTQDGVTLTTGQQIFLNGQTTGSQKGPWVVSAGAWVRPPDFLTGSSASGAFFVIENGTAFGGTLWICTNTPGSDIVDTSALTFVEMQLLVTVDATMTKTGNQLAVAQATATPSALGVAAVGSSSKSSKEDHVHVMPRLDQVSAPTAAVAFNAQKGTGIANGSASSDVAAYGQVTAGDATAIATSESYTDAQIAASGAGGVFWEPANTAALNAITITSAQVGKFAFKGDDDTLWLSLSAGTGAGHWTEVVGGMLALTGDVVATGTGSVPTQVHALTGDGTKIPVSTPLGGDGTNPLGFDAVAITMTTADYTLSPAEYAHNFIDISGTIGATRWLLLPAKKGAWFFIHNGTSDGFNVLAKASGGTGATVAGGPDGGDALVWCYDGTNYRGIRDFAAVIRGDLGGTSTNPTVIAITGVSGTAIVRAPLIGDAANTEPFRFGETGVVFATDADHTATATEYAHPVLGVTSTGSLTATRNLILPAANGAIYIVGNFTTGGETIVAKTPSGTGVAIPIGSTAVIACDGTNYFGIAAGSGGSDATSWYGVALDPSMASPSGGSYGAVPIFGGAYGSTSWEWAQLKFSLFDFSSAVTPTEGNLTSWGDKDGNLTVGDSGISSSSVVTNSSLDTLWMWGGGAATAGTSTRYLYPSVASTTTPSATEGDSKFICGTGYTLKEAHCAHDVAQATDNVTYTMRVNGVDTALTATINHATTSAVAVGSVATATGDRVTVKTVQSGTEANTSQRARVTVMRSL